MDPNPPKSSSDLLPGIAGLGVVVVIIILIFVALNYFNLISLNSFIPFLPQQNPISQLNNPQNKSAVTGIQNVQEGSNKCQPLPENVLTRVNTPTSSVSAELASFSGTWMGKWSKGYSAVMIVRDITPTQVIIGYFLNGVRIAPNAKFRVLPGNRLIGPGGALIFDMAADGIHGKIISGQDNSATIVLTRCTP